MAKLICGIDEAGRGPLAGPIVAAAVVMPEGFPLEAMDSKKLSEARREAWAEDFMSWAVSKGLQYHREKIEVAEINAHGIGWANREIFRRLIQKIDADEYIVDGNHKLGDLGEKDGRWRSVPRADQDVVVVAAASILAKTYRDAIMRELHAQHPVYNWIKNKGYGTREHIEAIKKHGQTEHHRNVFVDTVKSKEYASPHTVFVSRLFQSILPF